MRFLVCRLCAAALLLASSATAQDQRTYLYDAQGRLVGSTRVSSAPNSALGYGFDDVDNRLTRFTSILARPSTVNQLLPPGEALVPGQSIQSPNGQAAFVLQSDGNLVLYRPSGAIAIGGTATGNALFLAMQADGNLVLYGPTYQLIWFQATSTPGVRLVLQDDCNLVLYTPGNTPLWASGTSC